MVAVLVVTKISATIQILFLIGSSELFEPSVHIFGEHPSEPD